MSSTDYCRSLHRIEIIEAAWRIYAAMNQATIGSDHGLFVDC